MTLSDFGFSVAASWIANHLPTLFGKNIETTESPAPDIPNEETEQNRMFDVFDVYLDMEQILPSIREPVAH